jgi:hypothetical protein
MLWILLAVGVLLIAIAMVMLFSESIANDAIQLLAGLIAFLGLISIFLWVGQVAS